MLQVKRCYKLSRADVNQSQSMGLTRERAVRGFFKWQPVIQELESLQNAQPMLPCTIFGEAEMEHPLHRLGNITRLSRSRIVRRSLRMSWPTKSGLWTYSLQGCCFLVLWRTNMIKRRFLRFYHHFVDFLTLLKGLVHLFKREKGETFLSSIQ